MKKNFLSLLAVCLFSVSSVSLASCGNKEDEAGEATTLSILLSKGEDTLYYNSYDDNPVVKYLTGKTYNDQKINLNFYNLVSGSETDGFNTIISSGEYYDIMDLSYSNYSASSLVEDEILLDITAEVEEYMPNYMALINSNDELKKFAYTNVNGKKVICSLFAVSDIPQIPFEGMYYRRDWIVKYARDPKDVINGKRGVFTSNDGDDPNETYTDNVVFPSWYDATLKAKYLAIDPTWDGTYPVFISDWEWMMDAFDYAIDHVEGINKEKAYCISLPYTGATGTGDFNSGFGGGCNAWYIDGTTAKYGGTSTNLKSYLECMRTWYANGWVDKSFNERSGDMFYSIDNSSVRSGYVGAWCGRSSEYGDLLRQPDEFKATDGIMVFGAPQPINDKYGEESTKFHTPNSIYMYSTIGAQYGITTNCKNKDLKTILTFLDYLYSTEGAEVRYGIDPDKEIIKDPFYSKFGVPNGIYEKKEVNGETKIAKTAEGALDNYLATAGTLMRFSLGLTINDIDQGKKKIETDALGYWNKYSNEAFLSSLYTKMMTSDDSSVYAKVKNNVQTYTDITLPQFIMGKKNLENDWDDYCTTLNKYAPGKVTAIYQRILDELN